VTGSWKDLYNKELYCSSPVWGGGDGTKENEVGEERVTLGRGS
jgi:hypothetical protein